MYVMVYVLCVGASSWHRAGYLSEHAVVFPLFILGLAHYQAVHCFGTWPMPSVDACWSRRPLNSIYHASQGIGLNLHPVGCHLPGLLQDNVFQATRGSVRQGLSSREADAGLASSVCRQALLAVASHCLSEP